MFCLRKNSLIDFFKEIVFIVEGDFYTLLMINNPATTKALCQSSLFEEINYEDRRKCYELDDVTKGVQDDSVITENIFSL